MAERGEHRRKIRREKAKTERLELFVADYVKQKYKNIYNEATEYYNTLRQQNPYKIDLRKAEQYRSWAKHQVGHDKQSKQHPKHADHEEHRFRDNLQLEIPLMACDSTRTKTTATAETESLESLVEEIVAEGDIEPSLVEEIPDKVLEEIIDDLRQYPELENIFTRVEEWYNMDIEISDDDRLEKELM